MSRARVMSAPSGRATAEPVAGGEAPALLRLAAQVGNRAFTRLVTRCASAQRASGGACCEGCASHPDRSAQLGTSARSGGARPKGKQGPITVRVDLVKLAGSKVDPKKALKLANQTWGACGIRFSASTSRSGGPFHIATEDETKEWLGGTHPPILGCGSAEEGPVTVGMDEVRMNRRATVAFGLKAPIKAYFVPACTCEPRGYSHPPYDSKTHLEGVCVLCHGAGSRTLAHELGHMLGINRHPSDPKLIMTPGREGTGNAVTHDDCKDARTTAESENAGQPYPTP